MKNYSLSYKYYSIFILDLLILSTLSLFLFEYYISILLFFIFILSSWGGISTFSLGGADVVMILMILFTFFLGGFTFMPFYNLFILICVFSILFFCSQVFLVLYFFFESVLLPIMLIIFLWGVQPERSLAFLSLLFYSIFSALPLLFFINMMSLVSISQSFSLNSFISQIFVFSFLVKVPLFLFHYWLPKAHVEAPTAGSILLAGILLKLGGWGLFCLTKFLGCFLIFWMSLLGMVFGSLLAAVQSDIKGFIAFSSVCHMNFMSISLYFLMVELKLFSLMMMFSHAITSSLMFWFGGMFFHILHSRYLGLIQGTSQVSLSFNLLVFLFLASNFGIPPFVSFYSEFMFLVGLLGFSNILFLAGVLYLMMTCYYSMFLFNTTSTPLRISTPHLLIGEEFSFLFFSIFSFNSIFFLLLF